MSHPMLFHTKDENWPLHPEVLNQLDQTKSKLERITPIALHPNACIPGAWTNVKDLGFASKLPTTIQPVQWGKKQRLPPKIPMVEESEEEFFESSETLDTENVNIELTLDSENANIELTLDSDNVNFDIWEPQNHTTSHHFCESHIYIEPHMTEPLPDISLLDLSILGSQKGTTNVTNAVPLASAWEFNSCQESDECSLLHILTHELEHLDDEQPGKSLWGILKQITFGLSDTEYTKEYPWAKYLRVDGEDDEL